MSNRSLHLTGFVFSLLTAIGWILFIAGSMGSSQGDNAGLVANYLARADSTSILLYTWGGVLGSLSVIPVFLSFYQGFRQETGSVLIVPVTFGLIGVAFLTMGFMVDTGSMIYYFGPAVAASAGANAEAVAQAAQLAQDSIEVTWAIGSFLGYGGAVLWMALLFLKKSSSSQWLNWTGIIGGLAGFVWLLRFVPISAPQSIGFILLFLNIILTMVWLIGLSFKLARTGE